MSEDGGGKKKRKDELVFALPTTRRLLSIETEGMPTTTTGDFWELFWILLRDCGWFWYMIWRALGS